MLLLLDPYVDVILALALAYLSLKIVQALFGPMGGLPVVGGAITALEQTISRSLTHACGTIFRPVDAAVGKSLASVAGLIDRTAGFVRTVGRVLFGTAALAEALALAYAGIRSLAHELHGRFGGIEAGVKTLEREYNGIEHRVKALERDLTKGIGHDLRLTVVQTEKEVAHIRHKALPAIRAADAEAAGEIGHLYDWIRGKADIIGAGTFIAAVTAVIGADLLKLFRCPTFLNKTLGRGCGLWNGLEDLLSWFVDALILTDLCLIVPEAVRFFGLVEAPLTGLISQAANAICAVGNSNWTTVEVQPGPQPPAQAFDASTLASGG